MVLWLAVPALGLLVCMALITLRAPRRAGKQPRFVVSAWDLRTRGALQLLALAAGTPPFKEEVATQAARKNL